ncbi:putative CTCF-like protein, partial [Operophtera brumata]
METIVTETIEPHLTYYVDDQGHYYYETTTAEGSSLVALDPEAVVQGTQSQQIEDLIVPDVDGNYRQTVTLVPSENTNGEVSYVLVVADENKDLVNLDIEMDTEQASLQNHVNMHNGVKPHTCKYCKSTFTTSGELVRHVRYKHTHEKPHKCTECDYASVELSKLRRHVRCHTGERPYQPVYACELCPAKCGRKTDLRIHVQKLHTSEKPLKCKRCGKSFPDRYSCKVHNKTHEGEKCYKCDLCPYASTTLRHLKSHLLKHTDEKPFSCDSCDQSFSSLKRGELVTVSDGDGQQYVVLEVIQLEDGTEQQ